MCGYESQKSSLNTNLSSYGLLFQTMNVTTVLDTVVGGYFSSDNSSAFDATAVGGDMATILNPVNLWEDYGAGLVSAMSSYFIPVCASECDYNVTNATSVRSYVWEGPSDPSKKAKWDQYVSIAQVDTTLLAPFTFRALPESICPYEPKYCVPLEYAPMMSLLDEYCVPTLDSSSGSYITESASSVVDVDFGGMVGDLKTSWKLILGMAFGSLVIALIFLWILRLCVGVFVWLSVGAGFLLILFSAILALLYAQKCVGESVFSSAKAVDTTDEVSALFKGTSACAQGYSIPTESARLSIQIAGYVLFAVAGLYLILFLIFRKRIKLAIAINKVASQFIRQCKRSMFIPSAQTLVTIGWWALWLVVTAYAITIIPDGYRNMTDMWEGDMETASAQCQGQDGVLIDSYTSAGVPVYACKEARYLLNWQFWYSIFFLFWLNAFILGAGEMIIAGAVGVWYFTPNHAKGTLGAFPLRVGIRNTFVYHLGTVALGSLVLAIIRMIRFVFFWVMSVKKKTSPTSMVTKCLLVPVYFLIDMLHKMLTFLSRNAFIQTALFGSNFFKSCANAITLVASNPARLGALHVISALVEVLGLALITAGTGFSGWALLLHFYDGQIKSPLLPVIVMCIIAFGIALVVMSLFSMTVGTILQCFLADEELHKTEGGAKFTPSLLQRFLASADAREAGVQQPGVVGVAGPVGGQPISIVQ